MEVVGGLQTIPVLLDAAVLACEDAAHKLLVIELGKCLALHGVTQPARDVALFVAPRHGVSNLYNINGLATLYQLGRSGETDATLCCADGQSLDELEDVAAQGLEHTDGTELHANVDNLLALGQTCNPVHVLVCHEGILVPTAVGEADADVVAQLVVAHQQRDAVVYGARVNIVGTLPTENVLGTLNIDALIAHVGCHAANLVAIDEVGVANHLGSNTEHLLDALCLALNLVLETLLVADGSKAVAIGLGHEVHLTGLGQLLQQVDYVGSILLQHLHSNTREREGALEGLVLLAHLQQSVKGGHVAIVGGVTDSALVLVVVVVIVVLADVKETVALQMNRLVYLEI